MVTVNGGKLTVAADATITYGEHLTSVNEFICVKAGKIDVYGTIIAWNPTVGDGWSCYAIAVRPTDATAAAGIEINCFDGCLIKSYANAIKFNGQDCGGKINIYGGTIQTLGTSTYTPIYLNKSGDTTVVTIKGGTFLAGTGTDVGDGIVKTEDKTTTMANFVKLDDTCTAKFNSKKGSGTVIPLAELCADGYAPVLGQDGFYTIQKAYAITIAPVENGTLETSVTNNIAAGTEVTVTATPAENYVLVSITTNDVALADDVTTFVMPAENVTVAATFESAASPVANVTIGGETTPYTDLHAALVEGSVAGAVVELVDDVDLTGINWEPVPNFLGKFDGKGYTISNLKIDVTGGGAGLFGNFDWQKNHNGICNLVISNADVKATGSNVGVLAAKNGSDGGCVISNVTVCGSISVIGSSYVGGLVGHNQYSHIIDCHVIGDGAATSVIGYGEINEGTATGSGQIGGLVGMSGEGNMHVWNCSVEKVSVKGSGLVGAIWGRMQDRSVMVGCSAKDVDVYCAADVETAEVKIGTLVGGFVGGGLAPVINCTATNVKLYTLDGTPIDDRWTGTVAEGKNVARGTDVAGDAFTFKFSNPKLTAGTFEVMSAAAVTSLADWCQTGYAPIANGDGTYTIMQAWNVKFYVGDVVSNAQVVANGEYAKAFAYDTETIEAWTNAAGVAYTEVAITANTDFFAQVKAAPVITWPTDWPADADAGVKAKFAAWIEGKTITDFSTDAVKNAFLLNADPTAVPELKITSITVADGKATIKVEAGTADLATVNGVLYVESSDDLANWTTYQLPVDGEITGGDWTVTVNAGKFMKAKVGFKAPVAE